MAMALKADIMRARRDTANPTPGQAAAGNYRKGRFRIGGMTVVVETPLGAMRRGTDPDGNEWEQAMRGGDYGDLAGCPGADGDNMDVLVGPDPDSEVAFVVDQVVPGTGRFDEHKVLLGFTNREDAEAGYLSCYQDGWGGLGAITALTMQQLRAWAEGGGGRRGPIHRRKVVRVSEGAAMAPDEFADLVEGRDTAG